MNFDVHDLILLEFIERTGSFSAAAEQLFRTRSAITQHIQKLEDQVGFQIFDRSRYRPSLTTEGRQFLELGRPFLRNFERLRSDVVQIKQGWEGEFTIAIDDVFATENLYFLIEEFHKVAPMVNIRISREVLNGCWDALLEKRATLAIGVSGEPPIDLVCEQRSLGEAEFIFAVAKNHPLTRFPFPLTQEDLRVFPRIIISDTSHSLPKRSSGVVAHQSKIIVPTMESKINAQVMGLGVGYLPRPRINRLLAEEQLVELQLSGQTTRKTSFKIAWLAQSKSPSLAWFLNALKTKPTLNRLMGYA